MGSIDGHRIDYNGVGVLRGQWHMYPAKTDQSTPWGALNLEVYFGYDRDRAFFGYH